MPDSASPPEGTAISQQPGQNGAGKGAARDPDASEKPSLTDEEQRRYVEAFETLPLLTRAVLLLASRGKLPYPEIAWCCGISVEEVQVRLADALLGVGRYMRDARARNLLWSSPSSLTALARCLGIGAGARKRSAVGTVAFAREEAGQTRRVRLGGMGVRADDAMTRPLHVSAA